MTGCDVTRNSPRWLAKVRSAAGATGADALKVKVPANDGALNGAWSKNFAICPLAASVKLFWPKSFPAWSVKLKEMTTGELFVLAKATPVLIGPFTSAYVRPEIIESAYYLFHYTKDPVYLQMGVRFLDDLIKYCRVDDGYTVLRSVVTKEKGDRMHSFLLAETFKYLYLLFAPDDTIDFDHVTFNTEAHALKNTWLSQK